MRRYFVHVIAVLSTVTLVTAGTAGVSGAKANGTVNPTFRSALSSSSIPLGNTATDTATLIGKEKRGAPTGTVTFGVCGPTASATPCTSPNAGSATVSLTPGAKRHSTGSVTFSPSAAGWFCFLDQYGGDSHYKPVSDNDTSTECLHVTGGGTKTTPTLKTSLSNSSILLGSSAVDTATVTGSTAGGSPTGTVTFAACGPTTTPTPCTSPNVGSATAGLSQESGNRSVAGATITPGTTGWYCFLDQYNGDANYTSVSDNDTSSECLHVTSGGGGSFTPTITSALSKTQISPGGTTTDTVTVTGNATGGSPMGSVSFYVCGPTSSATPCTSTNNGLATVGLSAESGDRSVASLTVQVESNSGWFCFLDQYSGDANYTPVSDNDTSSECLHVTSGGGGSFTPTITSALSKTQISPGGTTTDTVTVTGNATGGSPMGSVSFYVCGPTSSATPCTSTNNGLATVGLSAESGDRSVASLTVQVESNSGWFCFLDQYSGDANYTSVSDNDASSECVHVTSSSSASHGSATVVAVSQSAPSRGAVKALTS